MGLYSMVYRQLVGLGVCRMARYQLWEFCHSGSAFCSDPVYSLGRGLSLGSEFLVLLWFSRFSVRIEYQSPCRGVVGTTSSAFQWGGHRREVLCNVYYRN